jgi:hypothetical protein
MCILLCLCEIEKNPLKQNERLFSFSSALHVDPSSLHPFIIRELGGKIDGQKIDWAGPSAECKKQSRKEWKGPGAKSKCHGGNLGTKNWAQRKVKYKQSNKPK